MYLRVSTHEQTGRQPGARAAPRECQPHRPRRWSRSTGITASVTPRAGTAARPCVDALCRAATKREFDVVMAWSVDWLGRTLQDVSISSAELHALRSIYSCTNRDRHPTPGGKAMFQMMGVFAESSSAR